MRFLPFKWKKHLCVCVCVSVQDNCCVCQFAGQVLGVSACRTIVAGISVQDKGCGCQCAEQVLRMSVCRTSVAGVSVQDKRCGCQWTGHVCWCRCAGQVLWVSVCSHEWLFVGVGGRGSLQNGNMSVAKRVCHMHVLLLAGKCEPIWAHGALQDQVLNQQPNSRCYLFWSGCFLVYLSGVFRLVQPCGRTMWVPCMTTYWHLQSS